MVNFGGRYVEKGGRHEERNAEREREVQLCKQEADNDINGPGWALNLFGLGLFDGILVIITYTKIEVDYF